MHERMVCLVQKAESTRKLCADHASVTGKREFRTVERKLISAVCYQNINPSSKDGLIARYLVQMPESTL